MPETQATDPIRIGPRPPAPVLRAPRTSDGAAIQRLVESSKPLDVNSTYAYLLLCRDFARTCVVAADGERPVGFVSAYRPPHAADVLFVWQVAVAESWRGRGLGRSMLRELLARDALAGCRYLETTVSPSNTPSRRLFRSLARELDAPVEERALFGAGDFGDDRHEPEDLIRIGPFAAPITRGERCHES